MRTLLALAFATGCAVKAPPETPKPPSPMPIALMGKFGAAHACPVAGIVVTAGHVAYHTSLVEGQIVYTPMAYLAEDGAGHSGLADPKGYNGYVDIALITLTWEPVYYEKGPAVLIGDEVSWVEYDFTHVRKAFSPRVRRARVINTRLGHIMFTPPPMPGASGSCVFNTSGQVVGIVSAGMPADDGVVGVAVDLSTLP